MRTTTTMMAVATLFAGQAFAATTLDDSNLTDLLNGPIVIDPGDGVDTTIAMVHETIPADGDNTDDIKVVAGSTPGEYDVDTGPVGMVEKFTYTASRAVNICINFDPKKTGGNEQNINLITTPFTVGDVDPDMQVDGATIKPLDSGGADSFVQICWTNVTSVEFEHISVGGSSTGRHFNIVIEPVLVPEPSRAILALLGTSLLLLRRRRK